MACYFCVTAQCLISSRRSFFVAALCCALVRSLLSLRCAQAKHSHESQTVKHTHTIYLLIKPFKKPKAKTLMVRFKEENNKQ